MRLFIIKFYIKNEDKKYKINTFELNNILREVHNKNNNK